MASLAGHVRRYGDFDDITASADGSSDGPVSRRSASTGPLPECSIRCGSFYEQYHGHPIRLLREARDGLRKIHGEEESCCIYLAGDSTVDNKYWLGPQHARSIERDSGGRYTAEAANGYEKILTPPRMVKDVCYWMNRLIAESEVQNTFVLNTAVEATTLASRSGGAEACCVVRCAGKLYAQDELIRDSMRESDILVTSIGGNDIALAPSICTVFFLVWLMLTPMCLLSACHPATAYFIWLFRRCTEAYIKRLVAYRKPKKIAACMVRFTLARVS